MEGGGFKLLDTMIIIRLDLDYCKSNLSIQYFCPETASAVISYQPFPVDNYYSPIPKDFLKILPETLSQCTEIWLKTNEFT